VSKSYTVNTDKFYLFDGRILENTKTNANLHFFYLAAGRLYHLYKDQSQNIVSERIKQHNLQNSAKNTFSLGEISEILLDLMVYTEHFRAIG
jgi:hypothetical protein